MERALDSVRAAVSFLKFPSNDEDGADSVQHRLPRLDGIYAVRRVVRGSIFILPNETMGKIFLSGRLFEKKNGEAPCIQHHSHNHDENDFHDRE